MKIGFIAFLFSFLIVPPSSFANPYLHKPGERLTTLRISTCAVSGGFVHLYAALDNGPIRQVWPETREHFYPGKRPKSRGSCKRRSEVHLLRRRWNDPRSRLRH